MKVLQINATYKIGSTGKIAADLGNVINDAGHESYILAGSGSEGEIPNNVHLISKDPLFVKKNLLISRISGRMGYTRHIETHKAISWIESIKPDVIHLHVIHGNYLNVELLFDYIKQNKIPVIWTMHDCWAFTGRCSYFESAGCFKWKTHCYDCPIRDEYPITYFFDFSKSMFKDKKKWFLGVDRMKIITPSYWLANYVKDSFLGQYPVGVIHNGIDLKKYYPFPEMENEERKIILGVASAWSKRKGLDDFIALSKIIDDTKYQIILIGLTPKQISALPERITGINRTNNENELIDYYRKAFVFFNPTYLDNYPTTNLEAQACGTPMITYRTGGSPESACFSEFVVEQGNIEKVKDIILSLKKSDALDKSLIAYSKDNFDKDSLFKRYLSEYESLMCDRIPERK